MKKAFTRSLNNLAVDAMMMQPLKPPVMMQPLKPPVMKQPLKPPDIITPEPDPDPAMEADHTPMFHPGVSPGSERNLYHEVWRKIASSMMDISLFLSNANQLANVIRKPNFESSWELFEILSLVLIVTSIALQILVGIMMIMTKRQNRPHDVNKPDSNRFTSICVFLIFVMNVLILCINNEPTHFRCPQIGCLPYNGSSTYEPQHNTTESQQYNIESQHNTT